MVHGLSVVFIFDSERVKEIILLTSLPQAKPPGLLAYVHKQVDLFIQCEGLKCVCFPYLVSKLSDLM